MGNFIFKCNNCTKTHSIKTKAPGVYHIGDLTLKMANELENKHIICECGNIMEFQPEINVYMWVKDV